MSRSNSSTVCLLTLLGEAAGDRFGIDRALAVAQPAAADPWLVRLPLTVLTQEDTAVECEPAALALVLPLYDAAAGPAFLGKAGDPGGSAICCSCRSSWG